MKATIHIGFNTEAGFRMTNEVRNARKPEKNRGFVVYFNNNHFRDIYDSTV